MTKQAFIQDVIHKEEERFLDRLGVGIELLTELVTKIKADAGQHVTGLDAFVLHDTHGIPFDLTEDFAQEHGLTVDKEGFTVEMEQQKTRARAAYKGSQGMRLQTELTSELKSSFVGYEEKSVSTSVLAIFHDDMPVDSLSAGDQGIVVLSKTPFYAESGGQVSDSGQLYNDLTSINVTQVSKGQFGEHLHQVAITKGMLSVGDPLSAVIDVDRRQSIARNHTAVHLLHAALRQVLGEHVQQAGSLVSAESLRFDFSHLAALTKMELNQVEQLVNEQIWLNTLVSTHIRDIQTAKAQGAMALFGEKYGEFVRVVEIGDFSIELCGGTHVTQTGQLGIFKILVETSVGASVRRIEAVVAQEALHYLNDKIERITELANDLKCPAQDISQHVAQLRTDLKLQTKEKEILQRELHKSILKEAPLDVQSIEGIPVLVKIVVSHNIMNLKDLMSTLRSAIPEGVILLLSSCDQKAQLVLSVSDEYASQKLQANCIIGDFAELVHGRGGGRTNLAQATGPDITGLSHILSSWRSIIQKHLST